VHTPGVVVTRGVMGGLLAEEHTVWHVDGVGLNDDSNEEIGACISVYEIGHIPSDCSLLYRFHYIRCQMLGEFWC